MRLYVRVQGARGGLFLSSELGFACVVGPRFEARADRCSLSGTCNWGFVLWGGSVVAHQTKSGKLRTMDAEEMLPTSPRGSLVNNGISVPPAATTGAFLTGGHSGSWGGFNSAFETPVEDMKTLNILKDADPEGLYKALLAQQYLQGPPAPQQEVIPQAPAHDMIYLAICPRGEIAIRYEAEFRRLELDPANREVLEEGTDHVDILQQNISAPGVDMNTATPGPFIVPTPGNTVVARPTAPIEILIPKLVGSTLEPIGRQQERAAAEKVLENFEVIPVNLEHNSSESFNEGSSSSNSSQQ